MRPALCAPTAQAEIHTPCPGSWLVTWPLGTPLPSHFPLCSNHRGLFPLLRVCPARPASCWPSRKAFPSSPVCGSLSVALRHVSSPYRTSLLGVACLLLTGYLITSPPHPLECKLGERPVQGRERVLRKQLLTQRTALPNLSPARWSALLRSRAVSSGPAGRLLSDACVMWHSCTPPCPLLSPHPTALRPSVSPVLGKGTAGQGPRDASRLPPPRASFCLFFPRIRLKPPTSLRAPLHLS